MTDQELSSRVAVECFGWVPEGQECFREKNRDFVFPFTPYNNARDAERVWDWLVERGSASIRRTVGDAAVSVLTDEASVDLWEPDWKRALCLAALEVASAGK